MERRHDASAGGSIATIPVAPGRLRAFVRDLARAAGMEAANAERFGAIYLRATLRGQGHHDVSDLPLRIQAFRRGTMNPNPTIRRSAGRAAIEGYDGDNGPGELCSDFILARALELAQDHGVGLCTVSNSNHFLAAAPYVEQAAERGCLGIVLSRSKPVMGVPGCGERLIGNGPLGFAAPTEAGYPVLLDICVAYASFGTLEALAQAGARVPPTWGGDSHGVATTDPAVITDAGVSYPIGGHKGFGLGLLVEILTGALAGGPVADGIHPANPNGSGVHSQTAIVIHPDALMPAHAFRAKVTELIDRVTARAPTVRIPGRASFEKREQAVRGDAILLRREVVGELDALAVGFGVEPMCA